MLRKSNVAPTILEYSHLNGPHDYNQHPLAPLVCAVLLHDKPAQRSSCSMQSIHVWYTGNSMGHYRDLKIWTKETKSDKICETLFLKHKYLTQTTVTPADEVMESLKDPEEVF